MRVEIYNGEPQAVEEVLTLRLKSVRGGERIQLVAVDPRTGEKLASGVLMEFFDDGTFKRIDGATAPGIRGKIEEQR